MTKEPEQHRKKRTWATLSVDEKLIAIDIAEELHGNDYHKEIRKVQGRPTFLLSSLP